MPISFSNASYGAAAIHSGGDVAICAIHNDYKTSSSMPIIIKNLVGSYSSGWSVHWLAVGI